MTTIVLCLHFRKEARKNIEILDMRREREKEKAQFQREALEHERARLELDKEKMKVEKVLLDLRKEEIFREKGKKANRERIYDSLNLLESGSDDEYS